MQQAKLVRRCAPALLNVMTSARPRPIRVVVVAKKWGPCGVWQWQGLPAVGGPTVPLLSCLGSATKDAAHVSVSP